MAQTITVDVDGSSKSVTSNAKQDRLLAIQLAKINADRTAQNPPLPVFAIHEYLFEILKNAFLLYASTIESGEAQEVEAAYKGKSTSIQNAVRTALGLPPV